MLFGQLLEKKGDESFIKMSGNQTHVHLRHVQTCCHSTSTMIELVLKCFYKLRQQITQPINKYPIVHRIWWRWWSPNKTRLVARCRLAVRWRWCRSGRSASGNRPRCRGRAWGWSRGRRTERRWSTSGSWSGAHSRPCKTCCSPEN